MTEAELFAFFGKPLGLNPEAALQPVNLPVWKPETGPYYKVQYVIELIGPNLISAQQAKALLEQNARTALGNPEIYVMIPGQSRWQTLWPGEPNLTYDSLAFAWDLVSENGQITAATANELWKRTETVGKTLQRRAAPLPPPDDAARAASNLRTIKDSLDIGLDILISPKSDPFDAKRVFECAYEMGFALRNSGLLEWKQQGWPEPLLTIFPAYEGDLLDPKSCPTLDGLAIGFSVPCSPAPEQMLERTVLASDAFCEKLGGTAADDDGRPMTPEAVVRLGSSLANAVRELRSAGLEPGSAEALRLFSP